jgi:hypothetical protein
MARKVSVAELRRLFFDIRDRRPDVRVRVRILGKMWAESFCSIDFISGGQVVLFDSTEDHYHYVNNINDIIQFELECPFLGYIAFYHYEVVGVLNAADLLTLEPRVVDSRL